MLIPAPETRPLRLGIGFETVPAPPQAYLTGFLTSGEIEVPPANAERSEAAAGGVGAAARQGQDVHSYRETSLGVGVPPGGCRTVLPDFGA